MKKIVSLTESDLTRIIKRVLKEEVTETNILHWELPKKLVKELEDRVPDGLKLYRDNDIVYVQELWFDTRKIIFALYTQEQFGVEINYDDSFDVPSGYNGYYSVDFDSVSKDLKIFILRRLEHNYIRYLL
jgi:hypothetical protein